MLPPTAATGTLVGTYMIMVTDILNSVTHTKTLTLLVQ
jgi:hypothetical protein